MSLWLPCGLHGFAVPNTVTVTVTNSVAAPSYMATPVGVTCSWPSGQPLRC